MGSRTPSRGQGGRHHRTVDTTTKLLVALATLLVAAFVALAAVGAL